MDSILESSSSSSSSTPIPLGGLDELTTDDEEDEDDIAVAAEAAANALEGADAVAELTSDATFADHDLPHDPLLNAIVAPEAAPPVVAPPPHRPPPGADTSPLGPCRICGQPAHSRPVVRFVPAPATAAVAKAAPGVTTFGEDICLHIFCGKTAGFLPGGSDPGLEIMTKAGIKNKFGIGQAVNAALARTRPGVPVAVPEQLRDGERPDSACAASLAGETTGTGEGSAAAAAAASSASAASKERQFYLVREFEAHLAGIRNTILRFPDEGARKSRPATAARAQQQRQRQAQRRNPHPPLASRRPSDLPPASSSIGGTPPLDAITNPGPLLHFNLMQPFGVMGSAAAPETDAMLLQQHYAAGPNGDPSLLLHFPYPTQPYPMLMDKPYHQAQALGSSVDGTSDWAMAQPTRAMATATAGSFFPVVQRQAPSTPGGSPAPLPFVGRQQLAPVGGAASGTGSAKRRTRKAEAVKAATGKVQKRGPPSLPAARASAPAAAKGGNGNTPTTDPPETVMIGTTDSNGIAAAASGGSFGDDDDVAAAAAAAFLDDGKVRCGCGGTYAANDGTPRGIMSWRNHALTKRHQKWMDNLGSNGSVGAVGTKTTTQRHGNGTKR